MPTDADKFKSLLDGFKAAQARDALRIREIQADDSFGYQQALKDGYRLVRSYLRDGAYVRTLVFEKEA